LHGKAIQFNAIEFITSILFCETEREFQMFCLQNTQHVNYTSTAEAQTTSMSPLHNVMLYIIQYAKLDKYH